MAVRQRRASVGFVRCRSLLSSAANGALVNGWLQRNGNVGLGSILQLSSARADWRMASTSVSIMTPPLVSFSSIPLFTGKINHFKFIVNVI